MAYLDFLMASASAGPGAKFNECPNGFNEYASNAPH